MRQRRMAWWEWPAWNTRNLAVTAIGFVIVLAVIGSCRSGTASGHVSDTKPAAVRAVPAATGSIATTTTTPATQTVAAPSTTTVATIPQPPPPGGTTPVTQTCITFVHAWAAHTPPAVWHVTVDRYATPSLQAGLNDTDPELVPATIIGPVISQSVDQGGGQVEIETNAGPVVCVIQAAPGGYLVNDLEPVG